jgi:hypothetical protein
MINAHTTEVIFVVRERNHIHLCDIIKSSRLHGLRLGSFTQVQERAGINHAPTAALSRGSSVEGLYALPKHPI